MIFHYLFKESWVRNMTEWLIGCFIKDYQNTKDPAIRTSIGSVVSWIGILSNIILVSGKFAIGFIAGSVSVIADGLNNLLDTAGSIISLVGFKVSSKKADKEHPFGHGRYEYISGLAVALLVLIVGIELGKSSLEKIISPTPIEFGMWSFIVLALSVLLKLWLFIFNRNAGIHIESTALKATATDSFGDAIATTAVLLSALISYVTGVNLDGWAGLGVAIFIAYNGVMLIKDTLGPLLGEPPSQELVKYIFDKIASYDYVLSSHDLIVHDYGPNRRFASVHVEISSDVDAVIAHEVIDNIECDFLKDDNIHLIIHYDPVAAGEQADKVRAWLEQQLQTIGEKITIHDLRIVEVKSHTEYIFDVVLPAEVEMTELELEKHFEKSVPNQNKPVIFRIKIDRSYLDKLL